VSDCGRPEGDYRILWDRSRKESHRSVAAVKAGKHPGRQHAGTNDGDTDIRAITGRRNYKIILAMVDHLSKGKNGIIFGALDEKSIAWKTAQTCYKEGANIVLTNAPVALRMGEINKLAEECGNAPVIGADVTNLDDLRNLFEKAMEHFGGKIDFILHSIGMGLNVRKGKHYTEDRKSTRLNSSHVK